MGVLMGQLAKMEMQMQMDTRCQQGVSEVEQGLWRRSNTSPWSLSGSSRYSVEQLCW